MPTPQDNIPETAASAEAQKIGSQLLKEGGRGAVLLGAARLDLALEKLLKASMQPHIGGEDNLFDPDRPLGTFSAKIALAYRLGLVDKQVEHALQMVRKVRNDFAHSFEESSLAEQSHRNRLSKPYAEARKGGIWQKLAPLLEQGSSASPELRDYVCLIITMVAFMEAAVHMLEPTKPSVQVHMTSFKR